MKKIALISDGWRRLVTYSWADGIMSYAKEMGEDICLYYFNTNGNWSRDRKYNAGEYNLYTLPNYEEYDGIVFDGTNTTDQSQLDRTVARLKMLNIPIVSISYAVEGFYYVGNDNKKLFRQIIDHLYQVHGCRDFVFAGGPDYNYENQMRYKAFKKAMEDYGIPYGVLQKVLRTGGWIEHRRKWKSMFRQGKCMSPQNVILHLNCPAMLLLKNRGDIAYRWITGAPILPEYRWNYS